MEAGARTAMGHGYSVTATSSVGPGFRAAVGGKADVALHPGPAAEEHCTTTKGNAKQRHATAQRAQRLSGRRHDFVTARRRRFCKPRAGAAATLGPAIGRELQLGSKSSSCPRLAHR